MFAVDEAEVRGGGLGAVQSVARTLSAMDCAFETPIRRHRTYPPEADAAAGEHPSELEAWAHYEDEAWTDRRAEQKLARSTFYFAEAQRPPGRRWGKRLVRVLALTRVRLGIFGLDLERFAVEASALLRDGPQPRRRPRGVRCVGGWSCAARARSRREDGPEPRDVHVVDGLVVGAGAPGGDADEIDLDGRWLLPALVNAHDLLDLSTLTPSGGPRTIPSTSGRRPPRSRTPAWRRPSPSRSRIGFSSGASGTCWPARPRCSTTTRTTGPSRGTTSPCGCSTATRSRTRRGSRPRCAGRTGPATRASPGSSGPPRGATRGCAGRSTRSRTPTWSARTP